MVDQNNTPTPSGDPAAQPLDAAGAASSSTPPAHGASAPLDDSLSSSKVVSLQEAAALRRVVEEGASSSDHTSPPPPQEKAHALKSGDRGESPGGESAPDKPAGEAAKPEKTIDWGKLNWMTERFTLIYPTDTAWDSEKRVMVKIANMAHAYSSEYVRMWKASERRRMVDLKDVVFDPAERHDPETMVNIYNPAEMVEPVEGDVTPFLVMLRHLLSGLSDNADQVDEYMHFVLCWFAYPLQHPGVKMKTALVFHGEEGSGKSLMAEAVAAIYGPYAITVGQDELEDKFNDWRSGKRFVIADEVSTRAEMVHNKNRIKPMITGDTVQINPKNMPRREERNTMHFVFLSNEIQPLALDNSDRRFFVVWTPRAREREFYRIFGEWIRNGGAKHLHQYLKGYPLEGFDPYAPAPVTQAKRNLISINRKSPEQFFVEWSEGELDLPFNSCSVEQAYRAYLKWCVRTGERYPFKREQWTPTVIRFSEHLNPDNPCRVKVMKLDSEGAKKAQRMFLVCEPEIPNGITQGEWATSAVEAFDKALNAYMWKGEPRSPEKKAEDGGDE